MVEYVDLPKCPNCLSNSEVRFVKGKYFRCSCGSTFADETYEKRRIQSRVCPVCYTYVPYDNWHLFYDTYKFIFGGKGKLRNFHNEEGRRCYSKYFTDIMKCKEDFETQLTKAEIVCLLPCPHCGKAEMCLMPDDSGGISAVIYMCLGCERVIPNGWVEEKIQEVRNARAK